MKKILCFILIAFLSFSVFAAGAAETMAAPAAEETVSFTDDLGRVVEVPAAIDSVCPSGSMAQVILLTFDASKLAGLTTQMSSEDAAYYSGLDPDIPVLGTFYGKKANLNKEALIVADPDVVIDIGEIKGSESEMISDLDVLQEQIGIPVVFIESYLADSAHTYTKLGELLNDEERAGELAAWAEDAVSYASQMKEEYGGIVTFYYSSAVDGLEALPAGNFHAEVLESVGGVNIVPSDFSEQAGMMSLEQLFVFNPDVIILSDPDAYRTATDPSSPWAQLDAVRNKRVYLVPQLINNWIDSPPSINRLIGIYWAADVLYGLESDVAGMADSYYSLFYGYQVRPEDLAQYGI